MTSLIDSEKKRAVKKAFNTIEGKILTTGLLLICGAAALLIIISYIYRDTAGKLLTVIATHLLSGRAGGISVGLNSGLSEWLVIITATSIDSLVVFILYPLFVLSYRRYFKPKFLRNVLNRSVNAAEKSKVKIRKYGMMGLLFFVWFPLHMTGPLVGSILGFMLGLHTAVTLVIVISGTFFAVLSWVYLFKNLITLTGRYSFYIPLAVIVIAVSLLVILRLRKKKPSPETQDTAAPSGEIK